MGCESLTARLEGRSIWLRDRVMVLLRRLMFSLLVLRLKECRRGLC